MCSPAAPRMPTTAIATTPGTAHDLGILAVARAQVDQGGQRSAAATIDWQVDRLDSSFTKYASASVFEGSAEASLNANIVTNTAQSSFTTIGESEASTFNATASAELGPVNFLMAASSYTVTSLFRVARTNADGDGATSRADTVFVTFDVDTFQANSIDHGFMAASGTGVATMNEARLTFNDTAITSNGSVNVAKMQVFDQSSVTAGDTVLIINGGSLRADGANSDLLIAQIDGGIGGLYLVDATALAEFTNAQASFGRDVQIAAVGGDNFGGPGGVAGSATFTNTDLEVGNDLNIASFTGDTFGDPGGEFDVAGLAEFNVANINVANNVFIATLDGGDGPFAGDIAGTATLIETDMSVGNDLVLGSSTSPLFTPDATLAMNPSFIDIGGDLIIGQGATIEMTIEGLSRSAADALADYSAIDAANAALAGTLEVEFDFPSVQIGDVFELIRLDPAGTFGDSFFDTINVTGPPSGLTAHAQIVGASVEVSVEQIPLPAAALLALPLLGSLGVSRFIKRRREA